MMTPDSEAAVADIIRAATGPICIEGGNTRGCAVQGEKLSLSKLSGITIYEPGALTLVAKAGTPLKEIEKTLAGERQRLAFEPHDLTGLLGTHGHSTIGGVIATNASGPRRIQGGAARDYALGVRFVDGAGHITKNGGRVMKNVTGYDLVKLMCGAHGTLGVLTEVSLKVLPVPETQGTLMLRNIDKAAAVGAMSAALGSPYEITGAAHCAEVMGDGPVTALRVEGFEASVAYRIEQLKSLLRHTGAEMQVASQELSEWFWTGARDVLRYADKAGDVWRISCKPSDAPALTDAAKPEACYYDWGGALMWMRVPAGTDLRARLGSYDGHAILVRGTASADLPRFQPESAGVAQLSAGLRHRFDPKAMLNQGLMGRALSEGV